MAKDSSVLGVSLANGTAEELRQVYAAIHDGLANETLRPVVGRRFPLAEAARAHRALMESGAHGKVVLIP